MNKKLNICAFVLALLLLVSLAGCGEASDKGEPAGTPGQTIAEVPGQTIAETPGTTSAAPAPILPEPTNPPEESVVEDEVLYVSTAGEFLEAIAPGVVIELAPGTYNLTEYLHEASDNVSDYVSRSFNDGWQAEIHEVESLTIRGAKGGKVEVVVEPRYCDVLYFNDCSDIVIENITFGHTIEQGNCEGAVLTFDYCQKISLSGLDLYGCGTYGVTADHTVGIALKDCIIRECSYGIVDLYLCSDAVFEGCAFRDNGGFDMLSLSGSFARFEGCSFTANMGDNFLPAYYYRGSESGARFERCSFDRWESQRLNEELKGHGNFVIGKDCRFEVVAGKRVVHVSNMEQMIENIAPDTQILLEPGRYNLSDTLTALYAREGGHFNESREFVRIDETYDGLELVVTGVSGLSIASESGSAADTEIVTDSRYANVLRFENCSDMGMMDITMGHSDTGDCAGDVLFFSQCSNIVLSGLDLYGCGVYGIGTSECGLLSCFDSTIRDCENGALDLFFAQSRQMFLNCLMTGSGSGGYFCADDDSDGEFYFYRCTFGDGESNSLVFNDWIITEDCIWSEITEYPDYSGESQEDNVFFALDMTRLKVAPFDAKVLTAKEYYILYEIIDSKYGEVSFETSDEVRFLTFEEDGRGCFWTDDEKGRPFNYEMNNEYSCAISFDDGAKANFGFYADQGGALPGSGEGSMWLALYLEDEALWFY
ncbi:MAG: right-handed parallel beta-helix repeat-containing protein [Lachnospiraceae bacterium]|nr:right-handed parallel beta-helix repeat-containing protein [Lachnospiraceae bacterium]